LRHFTGHTDEVRTAVFSPDGQYILTASLDGTARLWLTGLAASPSPPGMPTTGAGAGFLDLLVVIGATLALLAGCLLRRRGAVRRS